LRCSAETFQIIELKEAVMKKFLLAFLTIIALSGAVVMSHPSPALAFEPPDPCFW
jgi:hypothetical protein